MNIQRLSREMGWLTRLYKQMPIPVLFHDPDLNSYGRCYTPGLWVPDRYWHGQPEHVSTIVLIDVEPGAIAHEYRHHLQWCRHGPWSSRGHRTCPMERDAFAFERTIGGQPDAVLDKWCAVLDIQRLGRIEMIDSFPPASAYK